MARGIASTVNAVRNVVRVAATAMLVPVLAGCGTLAGGGHWGDDVTLRPGWQKLREAALDAARSPRVWVPLAGAALLQVEHADRRISDWARNHTPVFGSTANAADWSDNLRIAAHGAYVVTALATPGAGDRGEWVRDKAAGLALGFGAEVMTAAATHVLKKTTGRQRPNDVDDESFPSGHTSGAAVMDRLAQRNLRAIEMARGTRLSLDIGLDAITAGTAWARIESGAHYPSDTLFSIALGNFIGTTVNDAFITPGRRSLVAFTLIPLGTGGAELQWSYAF